MQRYGCGTAFELTPHADGQWTFSVLYDFGSGDSGAVPYGGVTRGPDGNLYGTTSADGRHSAGTAFELTPGQDGWAESTVFNFCPKQGRSGCLDGGGTQAALTLDDKGDLYGTKSGGGTDGGELFELTKSPNGWRETILHWFRADYDGHPAPGGSYPYAGLILDASGNLYGTTYKGGAGCAGYGCGTAYELSPVAGGGWKETVLHRFQLNGEDGHTPGWGSLIMDGSRRLYGTTAGGGCCGGVVFKLTPKSDGEWQERILHAFEGGAGGDLPYAGVVMDAAGNLYGTTDDGGRSSGYGVIYKLAPQPKGMWKYIVLYAFYGGVDGCAPAGNLVVDDKGNLYGGTVLGGAGGNGVIFELTP